MKSTDLGGLGHGVPRLFFMACSSECFASPGTSPLEPRFGLKAVCAGGRPPHPLLVLVPYGLQSKAML